MNKNRNEDINMDGTSNSRSENYTNNYIDGNDKKNIL